MARVTPVADREAPGWRIYFVVQSCDRVLRRATALGAHVIADATVVADVGCVALLRDPRGVTFGVIEPVTRKPTKP
jgi:predicted enzyme related to lactoylglutathione lyase